MQIESSLICDSASDYNGKLCVLGAFDTIWAPQAPINYPHCSVVVRVRFERSEEGQHKFVLLLIDADGNPHGPKLEGQANIVVPAGFDSVALNLILDINGLPLPRFDSYSFDFAVDGQQRASMPLRFVPAAQAQKAA